MNSGEGHSGMPAVLLRAQATGAALGLFHAGLLGKAGLYAESTRTAVVASAIHYAALLLLATVAGAFLGQLLIRLRPSRWAIFPVRGIAVAGGAGLWALSTLEPDGGSIGGAAAALVVVVAALAFAWREGLEPAARPIAKPSLLVLPLLAALWLALAPTTAPEPGERRSGSGRARGFPSRGGRRALARRLETSFS